MAKSKWFKLTQDVQAQFETLSGRVIDTLLTKGSFIEIGPHAKQVLLPNGDIMWGLTLIPAGVLVKARR